MITEFEFVLPKGFVDKTGTLHRQGAMRLATAKDEMSLQSDRRVQNNPAYSELILLSRVIIRLGTLSNLTPEDLEELFTLDLAYLREFFSRINQQGNAFIGVQCPQCAKEFQVELSLAGES